MVIEKFHPDRKAEVYARFHQDGRMLPEGLIYLDSWLAKEGDRCFQLMETSDPGLFLLWFEHWKDLVTFELIEVGEKPNEGVAASD